MTLESVSETRVLFTYDEEQDKMKGVMWAAGKLNAVTSRPVGFSPDGAIFSTVTDVINAPLTFLPNNWSKGDDQMWQVWLLSFVFSATITLLQSVLVMVAWDRHISVAIGAKPLGFWGALMVTLAVQALKLKIDFKG
jgi:hypothetical protein